MNKRKFISDIDQLIAEGKRLVSLSDDAKFTRKVTIVNLMLGGMSANELAPACGESPRTLIRWVKAVNEGGFESLRSPKKPGRPGTLTDSQKDAIKVAVTSELSGYGYNVWDGPALSDYIRKEYGVVLCVRQCQRLLHELGFALIRPQTFLSKGDEDSPERGDFKKTERTGAGSRCSNRISGRGTLHGGIHRYTPMVRKGQQAQGEILSRQEICRL